MGNPRDVVVDAAGDIYIADTNCNRIRHVDACTGIITTVAGNGTTTYSPGDDGGPATAAGLNGLSGLTVDSAGNIYITEGWNYRVRKVTAATGIITTVAGGGPNVSLLGDGGTATA